jgi:hypothetical protein
MNSKKEIAEHRKMQKQIMHIHSVWHEFERRFKDPHSQLKYKWIGYKLMCKIEKWAEKHPREVKLSHIDDAFFAGSLAAFIYHRTKNDYMGVTVVIVPQCTDQQPMEFFLYPDDAKSFHKIIGSIVKAGRNAKD